MPAKQPFRNRFIEKTVTYDGTIFDVKIYTDPTNFKDRRDYFIENFGNQMVRGKPCLDISGGMISSMLDGRDYTALIKVENRENGDRATGSVQVYDWCDKGKSQFWINDLCRIPPETGRGSVSPVMVLMNELELLAATKFDYAYLMVEKGVESEPILKMLYEQKYGYSVDDECQKEDSIIMKKRVNNYFNYEPLPIPTLAPAPFSSMTRKNRRGGSVGKKLTKGPPLLP